MRVAAFCVAGGESSINADSEPQPGHNICFHLRIAQYLPGRASNLFFQP